MLTPHLNPENKLLYWWSLMVPEGEIWGLKLSKLSWNTAEVKAVTSREDLWANPTINCVSTERFSIKQQLQHRTGLSDETPGHLATL